MSIISKLGSLRRAYRVRMARKRFYYSKNWITNSLGLTTKIKQQSHSKIIESWANKHAGKRCFIVGGGPSLKEMDLSLLKNDIVIGTNGAFKLHNAGKVKLNYLIMEDPNAVAGFAEDIKKIRDITILLAIHNASHAYFDHVIYFNTNHPYTNDYLNSNFQLSTQFHHIAFLGMNIIFLAIQLAFHLGFKEIYLIGVDLNYGENFMKQFLHLSGKPIVVTEEIQKYLIESHFSKDYYQRKIGETFIVPDIMSSIKAFTTAKSFCEERGVKIYNAGINSKLEVFDKVDYLSLF